MTIGLREIVLPFGIVLVIIICNVFCRDTSFIRQPEVQNNWSMFPSFDLKNSTTPWPPLGANRYHVANNNPTWVRPTTRPKQAQSFNFNVGPKNNLNSQQSSAPSGPISASNVTDDELKEFSESLLKKDVNNAANYVTINLQSKTTSRSAKDEAPLPLLEINKEAFNIPSIQKVLQLHDNYIVQSNVNEQYTSQEKQEEEKFLETVVSTPVMQQTRNFLIQKGKIGSDMKQFKDILRDIWFNMYARGGGKVGSSGFEHVFLTEIKNNQISGLHNWLYFDKAEKTNEANYLGYMKKLDLGNKGAILKYHFTFQGIDKPVGSMFIGTSPEFEMALYTTCFLLRADNVCPLKLNGNRFTIRTFTYRYRGKSMIGSAFPDI